MGYAVAAVHRLLIHNLFSGTILNMFTASCRAGARRYRAVFWPEVCWSHQYNSPWILWCHTAVCSRKCPMKRAGQWLSVLQPGQNAMQALCAKWTTSRSHWTSGEQVTLCSENSCTATSSKLQKVKAVTAWPLLHYSSAKNGMFELLSL